MTSTEDRAAKLLDEATRLEGNGETVAAGVLALEAAVLLPAGDPDRHSAFASAGALLAAAGRHAMAADAWAGAASDAMDHMVRARDLTAEGEAARLAGMCPSRTRSQGAPPRTRPSRARRDAHHARHHPAPAWRPPGVGAAAPTGARRAPPVGRSGTPRPPRDRGQPHDGDQSTRTELIWRSRPTGSATGTATATSRLPTVAGELGVAMCQIGSFPTSARRAPNATRQTTKGEPG